jgi:hypothetical protein
MEVFYAANGFTLFRRAWVVTLLLVSYFLFTLAARAESRTGLNRVGFIDMLKKREKEAVQELKSTHPNLERVREIVRSFRQFVTQKEFGPELRLRSTLALAVVCYWKEGRDLCRQELQGLGSELEDIGDRSLAQVVRSREMGEGTSASIERRQALYESAFPGVPQPAYP